MAEQGQEETNVTQIYKGQEVVGSHERQPYDGVWHIEEKRKRIAYLFSACPATLSLNCTCKQLVNACVDCVVLVTYVVEPPLYVFYPLSFSLNHFPFLIDRIQYIFYRNVGAYVLPLSIFVTAKHFLFSLELFSQFLIQHTWHKFVGVVFTPISSNEKRNSQLEKVFQ